MTGSAAALGIRQKHRVLTEFLTTIGVPPDLVANDVEGMEHHISAVTVKKIQALLPRLKSATKSSRAARSSKS